MQTEFPALYGAPKSFAGPLSWTAEDRDFRLSCPLERDGVVVEGLDFVARATKTPDKACHFMLRALDARGNQHLLERIDWRPVHSHNNKGRGPKELQLVDQTGAHAHSFEMNWIKAEGRLLTGGLPLAMPIDIDRLSAEEAFAWAAQRFNIDLGGGRPPTPPWELDLFNNG